MNSKSDSTDDGSDYRQETIGPYGYSIGISLGILLVLIIITYCYYICTRFHANTNNINQPTFNRNSIGAPAAGAATNDDLVRIPQGLAEPTLFAYPNLVYSQAKHHHEGGCSASGCSICLQDYKDNDMLRLLPECGHLFHLKCVDPWLKLHPTCPICRNSPMPSPLGTPVLEMSPLSTR